MKCYNHNNVDAVGISKACNKGVCKEFAIDIENGIACSEECVTEVLQMNKIIESSKYAIGDTSMKYVQNGALLFVVSIFLLYFSNVYDKWNEVTFFAGLVLCLLGFLNFFTSKLNKK